MIDRHPTPNLLSEYSAGSLALAPSIAVTTHLQFCNKCCDSVNSLQQLGGHLLEEIEATPISEGLLDSVLEGIQTETQETRVDHTEKHVDAVGDALPGYVRGLLPQGNLNWKSLSPSLKVATLSVGEEAYELALHRILAGGKAPKHNHSGEEITVVLTGTFSDEGGIYQAGDFLVRRPGDVHRPIAAQNEDCICLSVLAAPIQLTGIKRLANPFLSFSPS